jgi:hypothetical protein
MSSASGCPVLHHCPSITMRNFTAFLEKRVQSLQKKEKSTSVSVNAAFKPEESVQSSTETNKEL